MKKTLAALAVLGAFSGAAFAQSNVEIYGIIDGGFRLTDPTVDNVESKFGVQSGAQSGSRFGFKGSENLGNGLKAVFQLEQGFNLDDGTEATNGSMFSREARLGLEGKFGAINMGRFGGLGSGTGSQDMLGNLLSPFGTSFEDAGAQATVIMTDRVSNAVSYMTPVFAGLKAGLMYSFSVEKAEAPSLDKNDRYAGIGFNYNVGKLAAGLTYEQLQAAEPTAKDDTKALKLAASYDFGVVKPFASYVRAEGGALEKEVFYNGNEAIKSDAFSIGASAPLFGGSLLASYQFFKSDDFRKAGAAADTNFERQVFAVGYDYSLSKRTNVYGVMSFSAGDGAWDKDQTGAAGLKPVVDVNRNVYEIGLRHKF